MRLRRNANNWDDFPSATPEHIRTHASSYILFSLNSTHEDKYVHVCEPGTECEQHFSAATAATRINCTREFSICGAFLLFLSLISFPPILLCCSPLFSYSVPQHAQRLRRHATGIHFRSLHSFIVTYFHSFESVNFSLWRVKQLTVSHSSHHPHAVCWVGRKIHFHRGFANLLKDYRMPLSSSRQVGFCGQRELSPCTD